MSSHAALPFPAEIRPRTVPELLDQQAEAGADRVGFVARGRQGRYEAVTFGAWRAASERTARELREQYGIRPGDRVAWIFPNADGLSALVLYHAIARLAAVSVPINDRLTVREAGQIVRHSGSRILIVGEDRLGPAAEIAESVDFPVALCSAADGEITHNAGRASGRLPGNVSDGHRPPEGRDDLCLVYTSGTTGLPKGVLHTHGSALAAGLQWADVFRLRGDDVLQSPFPIFGGAGLHFNGLSALWSGATFVVEHFAPAETTATMAAHGTTVYVAVPTVYRLIMDQTPPGQSPPTRLRILDYGGASMPPALIQELRRAFPDVGLMQTYGLTEAGPGGTYLPEEYALDRLGSVGNRPMGRYTEFRVVREDGMDAGPGELGEFIIRGPSLMKEYYRDPEATGAAIRDGWLYTGDIMRIDEHGFLYYVDRRKDLVIRGGYNISSAEVEAVLIEHPAVQEAAVVAKPHRTLGEDTKAYVVLRDGRDVSAAELVAHCSARLADWKVPRDIELRADLPRNAAGKVRKHILRQEARDSDAGNAAGTGIRASGGSS